MWPWNRYDPFRTDTTKTFKKPPPPRAGKRLCRNLLNGMDGKKETEKRCKKRRKLECATKNAMVDEEGVTIVKGSPWQIDWKSLSKTMKIVRSKGVYLYDENEEKFLDCVSGVSHVGHSHPSVVAAAQSVLTKWGSGPFLPMSLSLTPREPIESCNSGSRFCNRILSTFNLPNKLNSTLVFNSGSQANDVALQIARSVTGGHDVVIFEDSFHGCLSVGNELSGKMFDCRHKGREFKSDSSSRGECRKSPWVHVIPVPDVEASSAGNEDQILDSYYMEAIRIIDNAVSNGAKIACVITEPIFTFHSVLVPDSKYLRKICSYIKDLGGLVIIDEVQTGLCRTGHWWGYNIHNIEPDIVTTGKALACGHPMSLLATSKENIKTLGAGDAVMYKITPLQECLGISVLDVVEREKLMSHASKLGAFIKEYINDMMKSRVFLGGIRGEGLILGIQLVNANKKPDGNFSEKILLSLRGRHIVSAVDGKFGNILFLIPPLCFSKQNALTLLKNLDEILVGFEKNSVSKFPLGWPELPESSGGNPNPLDSDQADDDNVSVRSNTSTSSSLLSVSTSSSCQGADNAYETMD